MLSGVDYAEVVFEVEQKTFHTFSFGEERGTIPLSFFTAGVFPTLSVFFSASLLYPFPNEHRHTHTDM